MASSHCVIHAERLHGADAREWQPIREARTRLVRESSTHTHRQCSIGTATNWSLGRPHWYQPRCPQLYLYGPEDVVCPAEAIDLHIERVRQGGIEVHQVPTDLQASAHPRKPAHALYTRDADRVPPSRTGALPQVRARTAPAAAPRRVSRGGAQLHPALCQTRAQPAAVLTLSMNR